MRKQLLGKKKKKDRISWRGHEVSRIEAFSDAVFAFAVTLLVVSLEVPKTFHELMEVMMGFIPFAICFAMFFQIWVSQNLFFRRFGLHDETTIALNAMLLFVVLFFVYPLKFLWTSLLNPGTAMSDGNDWVHLFYIYGAAFTIIYVLLGLMYGHAIREREYLDLSDSEVFEARTFIYRHFGTASVGVLSIVVASLGPRYIPYSGMCYALVGLVVRMMHGRRGKIHTARFGTSVPATGHDTVSHTDMPNAN